ncbi:hypothetical protein ACOSQ3_010683 [Xanthoceras sorbifolium]
MLPVISCVSINRCTLLFTKLHLTSSLPNPVIISLIWRFIVWLVETLENVYGIMVKLLRISGDIPLPTSSSSTHCQKRVTTVTHGPSSPKICPVFALTENAAALCLTTLNHSRSRPHFPRPRFRSLAPHLRRRSYLRRLPPTWLLLFAVSLLVHLPPRCWFCFLRRPTAAAHFLGSPAPSDLRRTPVPPHHFFFSCELSLTFVHHRLAP